MRVTRKTLYFLIEMINATLKRPASQFASKTGEPIKFSIGHYSLDKNATGWMLEEQVSERGATTSITGRLSTSDMALYLRAYHRGIVAHKSNQHDASR